MIAVADRRAGSAGGPSMLFSSYAFLLVFLPLTLAGYYFLRHFGRREASISFLLVASLVFYAQWNLAHCALLILSIAVNYALGRLAAEGPEKGRRVALHVAIAFNLSLIFWFKYFDFAASNAAALVGLDYALLNIVLPLGISFFTFQQVAYVVDCHRTGECERSPRDFALFVTFFPQLIAGPIVHHGYTRPQFANLAKNPVNLDLIPYGVMIFAMGLAKKTLIADPIARAIDPLFAAAGAGDILTAAEAWTAMVGYALQIYFDFSGYCDMAIGLGLLFGIRLPINFMSPYKARSIIEFWRRWHMTLSAFLRDYVYIALGGNRKGELFRLRNVFLTMLIGGVWHGAAWTFVIWGLIHAALITLNHAARLWLPQLDVMRSPPAVVAKRAALMTAVMIAWIFFRSETLPAAFGMTASLVGAPGPLPVSGSILALMALAAGLALFAPNSLEIAGYQEKLSAAFPRPAGFAPKFLQPTPLAALSAAILLVGGLAAAWKPAVFIYFNF
ncbi:MAG: MBOAT family protein [Parvularculaceae bacterium]|nr:MBOAT family protein [Parvularculaceae bacterium]